MAGRVENGMAHPVCAPNLAVGLYVWVIPPGPRLITPCCLGHFPELGLIIRMDALKKCFESRQSTMRVKTQQSVDFFGPVPDLASGGRQRPTPPGAPASRVFFNFVAAPTSRVRLLCSRVV